MRYLQKMVLQVLQTVVYLSATRRGTRRVLPARVPPSGG
jgi:hypothetical protein